MLPKRILFPVSLFLSVKMAVAHSGHATHSPIPDLLAVSGVFAGVVIAAAGLYLSLKKYSSLEENAS